MGAHNDDRRNPMSGAVTQFVVFRSDHSERMFDSRPLGTRGLEWSWEASRPV
jgi:hypothetical protein